MAAPKYKLIEQALLARIAGGEFAPGDAIPHEAQLAKAYGVTRPTISRALSALVEQGLIERRRRAGSRVATRGRVGARMSIPLVREAIVATGAAYGYRLIERVEIPPPPDIRDAFGLRPAVSALYTLALHLADDRPWQVEDRWINLTAAPEAAAADFAAISPNEWLVAEIPFTRTEHVLRAAAADAVAALWLGVPLGAPLFVVERATWRGAVPVTRVVMLHPAESYRMVLSDGDPATS